MTILRLREERNKKTSGLLIWAQFFNVFQMVFIVDIFYISFDSSLGVCANTHTHTHTHTHKHTHTHTHTHTDFGDVQIQKAILRYFLLSDHSELGSYLS